LCAKPTHACLKMTRRAGRFTPAASVDVAQRTEMAPWEWITTSETRACTHVLSSRQVRSHACQRFPHGKQGLV
jgi:hypothetical protein